MVPLWHRGNPCSDVDGQNFRLCLPLSYLLSSKKQDLLSCPRYTARLAPGCFETLGCTYRRPLKVAQFPLRGWEPDHSSPPPDSFLPQQWGLGAEGGKARKEVSAIGAPELHTWVLGDGQEGEVLRLGAGEGVLSSPTKAGSPLPPHPHTAGPLTNSAEPGPVLAGLLVQQKPKADLTLPTQHELD